MNIAIIGGGLSGTLSAICLLRQSSVPLTIHLFEKETKQLHRGVAYSSKLSHQLLNVPANHMALFNDEPSHFYGWLLENGYVYEPDDFVPRHLFGDYVNACFCEALENTTHAVAVSHAEVTALLTLSGKYVVSTTTGDSDVLFDHVLLCTGNFPPADMPGLPKAIAHSQLYIPNPWSGEEMQSIAADEEILVVGSGLTMVDQVLSLKQRGHRGKITVVSRRGMLPRAHDSAPAITLQYIHDFKRMGMTDILRWIRTEIQWAEKQGKPWRSVINALRDLTPAIWRGLSDADKGSFLRHLRPFWEVHRHRIPTASNAAIAEMQQSGQLTVVAGRVHGGELAGGKAQVYILLRGTGAFRQLRIDRIVNCTGPQSQHKKIGSELFAQLRDSGLVMFDLLGMGIHVGEGGSVVAENGSFVPSFHVVGPPAKGTLWECTALREIRNQCHELAKKICDAGVNH